MAVAFDNSSELSSASTSVASFTWDHLPATTIKGVLVFTFTNANADDATAVSYDGTSLTAVSGGRAVDTAGEPGDCKAWLLAATDTSSSRTDVGGRWAARPSGPTGTVLYANGLWVGATNSDVLTSTSVDGPWSPSVSGALANARDIDYGNGVWSCVADSLRYTSDPAAGVWSSGTGFSGANAIAGGDGYWVLTGGTGAVRYTTSLTGTWSTPTAANFGTSPVKDVAYYNGTWVAVGDDGKIRVTTDPTGTWAAPTNSGGLTTGDHLQGVAYGGGYWVVVGYGGVIRYATDPTGTWSTPTSTSSLTTNVWGVAYYGGTWVVQANSNNKRYATDPTGTWSTPTAGAISAGNTPHLVGGGPDGWMVNGYSPGAKSIVVTRNNNVNEMYGVAITLKATYGVEVTGVALAQSDAALSEQNVDDGSPGTNSVRFAGVNSGLSGIVTNAASPGSNNLSSGANSTWAKSLDFGTRVAGVVYETTAGQGSRAIGFSSTTSDDVAAVYLAIREAIVPWTVGVPIR